MSRVPCGAIRQLALLLLLPTLASCSSGRRQLGDLRRRCVPLGADRPPLPPGAVLVTGRVTRLLSGRRTAAVRVIRTIAPAVTGSRPARRQLLVTGFQDSRLCAALVRQGDVRILLVGPADPPAAAAAPFQLLAAAKMSRHNLRIAEQYAAKMARNKPGCRDTNKGGVTATHIGLAYSGLL